MSFACSRLKLAFTLFLKHASQLEFAELAKWLVDDEYREAASVLKMNWEIPDEREFFEARRRVFDNLDYQLQVAREEGREEGRKERREEGVEFGKKIGILIGRIQILQQFFHESVATDDDLEGQGIEKLDALLAELQDRLRSRGE